MLSDGRIAFALGDFSTGDADVMTSIWDPRTLEQNFDGINQSDFLWQHDSGQAAVWLMNGTETSTPTAAAISSGRTTAAKPPCG